MALALSSHLPSPRVIMAKVFRLAARNDI